MESNAAIAALANVISLAVAPVFLLAGIATFVNVISTRLGRIVDRARIVARYIPHAELEEHKQRLQDELNALWRRIRLIKWSLRLCVSGAILVCSVVVNLFIGDFSPLDLSSFIAALFITAMSLVISGLVLFLLEVSVSARSIMHGIDPWLDDHNPRPPH